MFRYTIALDVSFSGKPATITQDDTTDMPMHSRMVITLSSPITTSGPGGTMSLPVGSQITGTIIGKQVLP